MSNTFNNKDFLENEMLQALKKVNKDNKTIKLYEKLKTYIKLKENLINYPVVFQCNTHKFLLLRVLRKGLVLNCC